MDYQFYEFMNKSKSSANQAVIESIQQGYLLCELRNGNITQAQYESLMDGLKKVAGTARKVLTAGMVAFALSACAGHAPNVDPNTVSPDEIVKMETETLNNLLSSSGRNVSLEDLKKLGEHCVTLISAEIDANANARDGQFPALGTTGWDNYMVSIYDKIADGTIKTPDIENAEKKYMSASTEDEQEAGEVALNIAKQKAIGAVLLPVNASLHRRQLAPDAQQWIVTNAKKEQL